MILLISTLLSVSPFYESNFTALPIRSMSVFSNPAGIGYEIGAELLLTYHPDEITAAAALGNMGIGLKKIDSITFYEVGLGAKLPGVFSVGYAYQFDLKDYGISEHILGVSCQLNQNTSLGYRTTLGEHYHMFGGLALRPFRQYLTLSFDVEYEGIDSIFTFYYGGALQPLPGLKAHFQANEDFDWQAGLQIALTNIKLAGAYSIADKKISAGIIFSAQTFETFLPKSDKITKMTIQGDYPELENKSLLGVVDLGTKQGFTKILDDLARLLERPDVKVVLVDLKENSLGPGQREELRQSLTRLKDAGKKVIFYADYYDGITDYELACLGDEVVLSPAGELIIPGITMRSVYIKNALEKIGIELDLSAIGKYKSAKEVFTRTEMSAEDKEQSEKYLDDIYYPILENIAKARNKTVEELEQLVDEIGYFNSDDAMSLGLIDKTMHRTEVEDYLKAKYGRMALVNFETLFDEVVVDETWQKEEARIALVIAEGEIVPGQGEPGLFATKLIGGDRYAEIFENLKRDKAIKAVVFRINSNGGESIASEEIAFALKKCAREKPVIVSFADIAASGGYHIACLADKIYTNGRTITGSIGVLSGNVVLQGLYDKLGISWDYVKRGKHSDALLGLRHLTDDELVKLDVETRWTYERFIKSVAEGRKMTNSAADSLAQGRIYSGLYAKEVKLVDEIGGYLDALDAAKKAARIKGDVAIVLYPKYLGFSPFSIGLLDVITRVAPQYIVK